MCLQIIFSNNVLRGWLAYSYLDPPSGHSWWSSSTDLSMISKWFKWCLTLPCSTVGTTSLSLTAKRLRDLDGFWGQAVQVKTKVQKRHQVPQPFSCPLSLGSPPHWAMGPHSALLLLLMYFKKPFLAFTSLASFSSSWAGAFLVPFHIHGQCLCIPPS